MSRNFIARAVGILLTVVFVFSLLPTATVQAQGDNPPAPTSCVPQWPVTADTRVSYIVEFSDEVDKPGNNVGDGSGHEGLDITAAGGTAVYPVLPGEIVHIGSWASWLSSPWGDAVIIKSTCLGHVTYLIYVHLDPARFDEITLGQWIQQGEPLGYMNSTRGNSAYWSEPHVHVGLFDENNDPVAIEQQLVNPIPTRDPYTQAEVVSDWMLIWDDPRDILGQNPPKAQFVESGPGDITPTFPTPMPAGWKLPTSLDEATDMVWELYTELYTYVAGERIVTVVTPDPPAPSPAPSIVPAAPVTPIGDPVIMSISAQSSDHIYQENIRKFFAGGSIQVKSLTSLNLVDLQNFAGSLLLPPGEVISVNTTFGWAEYEEGQGMGIPAGMMIGDGNCNAASAVRAALLRAGLEAEADTPNHNPVPGVESDELATVCIGTPAYPCTDQDVRLKNTLTHPVQLHWAIVGDTLTLWVERAEQATITPSTDDTSITPDSDTTPTPQGLGEKVSNWFDEKVQDSGEAVGRGIGQELAPVLWTLGFILIALLGLMLLFRPGTVGQAMLWVANEAPSKWQMWKMVIKMSSRWWLAIMAWSILLTPELAHISLYGFGAWLKGETTISHLTLVVVFGAYVANWLLKKWFYAKEYKNAEGKWVMETKKRGCMGNIVHLTVSLALIATLFWAFRTIAQGQPTPQPDPSSRFVDLGPIPAFDFKYWNGDTYEVNIPQDVWDASIEADQKWECDPRLIIAVAWSESPRFTNHDSENWAGAMGVWQFIPGTWNTYYPDASTRPSRTDINASADAACRKVVNQGLPTANSRAVFVDRFAHHPLKESVWNMHDGQANTVYDLWQELIVRTSNP